jgi:hypothetical protein
LPEFVDAFMDGVIRLGHRARGSREANCPVRRPRPALRQKTAGPTGGAPRCPCESPALLSRRRSPDVELPGRGK